jgi:hypothetical protein
MSQTATTAETPQLTLAQRFHLDAHGFVLLEAALSADAMKWRA